MRTRSRPISSKRTRLSGSIDKMESLQTREGDSMSLGGGQPTRFSFLLRYYQEVEVGGGGRHFRRVVLLPLGPPVGVTEPGGPLYPLGLGIIVSLQARWLSGFVRAKTFSNMAANVAVG
jgi:hypothetical protein